MLHKSLRHTITALAFGYTARQHLYVKVTFLTLFTRATLAILRSMVRAECGVLLICKIIEDDSPPINDVIKYTYAPAIFTGSSSGSASLINDESTCKQRYVRVPAVPRQTTVAPGSCCILPRLNLVVSLTNQ